MAEQDFDRSEQPTPYKLEQARQRGSVAKSSEVVMLAMLCAAAIALYTLPGRLLNGMMRLTQHLLSIDPLSAWTPDTAMVWIGAALRAGLVLLAPLFFVVAIIAVLANLVQVGPMFSPQALKPNFSKLNPAAGLKRIFSLRFAYDALKSCVKLALLLAVSYAVVHGMARGLLVLTSHDPKGYPGVVVGLAQSLFVKLILAMLFVALIDLVYSRWEFTRQMHMSRREVRDELKHREGDPRIRQKLRQLRVELLKRTRALRSVPGSDVIITNPTHIAVAVRYREEEGRGPKLLAKGAGDLALRMRRIAQRHGIPIVENRRLARALFREVDFDAFVPEQWYPEVARILVWVYLQRERQSQTRSLA